MIHPLRLTRNSKYIAMTFDLETIHQTSSPTLSPITRNVCETAMIAEEGTRTQLILGNSLRVTRSQTGRMRT